MIEVGGLILKLLDNNVLRKLYFVKYFICGKIYSQVD